MLPVPMMNVLNGGAHADNKVDFQEFMVVPVGAPSFAEALRIGAEVFHALKKHLHDRGLSTAVGDEGGFAPDLDSNEAALEVLVAGIEAAGHRPGEDVAIALDPATSEISAERRLRARARGPHALLGGAGGLLGGHRLALPGRLARGRHGRGGLGRLEDAHRDGRRARAAGRRRPVRDQHRAPASAASTQGVANSILIKVNQIGTLTETLEAIQMARDAGYTAVMSHRSGETEDTTIADLAVATGCGQIKTGAPSRSDRVAKYNQLLRIEEALGGDADVSRAAARSALEVNGQGRAAARRHARVAQRRTPASPRARAHPLGPGRPLCAARHARGHPAALREPGVALAPAVAHRRGAAPAAATS